MLTHHGQIIGAVCILGAMTSLAQLDAQKPGVPTETIRETRLNSFTAAVINAREWDRTQQEWMGDKDQKKPLFFDAAHRFLLLRFPDIATDIQRALKDGFHVTKAELILNWDGQEWLRVKGYSHRGYRLKGKPVDAWHARVWALKRPWIDDPERGPTWNAFAKDIGFWKAGGGHALGTDREEKALGEVKLSEGSPTGHLDISTHLAGDAPGAIIAQAQTLAENGFLIEKSEIAGPHHGEWGLSTGCARIWIREPALLLHLKKADPAVLALGTPPSLDALLAQNEGKLPIGTPSTQMPGELSKLVTQAQSTIPSMPPWMQKRVREVRDLPVGERDANKISFTLPDHLESGDRERYERVVNGLLRCPPGWFLGHSHLDLMMPLLQYGDMLPEVIHYHLRENFRARWSPPYSGTELRHRVGFHGGMATLNHQCQFRSEALLAAELLGLEDLELMAKRNLTLLNRQMLYSEGTIQERGDSFYLGISLSTLQVTAKHSRDPLIRLKAGLGIEKMLFESNMTYHPGLRRRVSRISRRYRIDDLLLSQSIPRAVLHTLSKKGVLIDTDRTHVYPDKALAKRRDEGETLT